VVNNIIGRITLLKTLLIIYLQINCEHVWVNVWKYIIEMDNKRYIWVKNCNNLKIKSLVKNNEKKIFKKYAEYYTK